MHGESNFGQENESTGEYGVTIASSLVKKYLDNDKKVGLLASGNHSYLFMPDTGEEQEQRISQALAAVQPSGVVPAGSLIASQEERINQGSAVIVITSAGYPSIGVPLRRLINRGVAVTVVLLDAASFGGNIAAAETARGLNGDGIHVYTVKRGMELSKALDIRRMSAVTPTWGVNK